MKHLFTHHISTQIKHALACGAVVLLLGCAGKTDMTNDEPYDPFEPINRVMFDVHNAIDKTVLIPAAKAYGVLPRPARTGIRNFLYNLGEPVTMLNAGLQGEPKQAGIALARFSINTTIGLGGLIDMADDMGLAAQKEDFGQTLGVHGVAPGPYLFIPIFGPRTMRDAVGAAAGGVVNTAMWDKANVDDATHVSAWVVSGVQARHSGLGLLADIEASSVDYYASVRSLYLQNRQSAIENGKTDIDNLPDLDMLDELDELDEVDESDESDELDESDDELSSEEDYK